MNLKKYGTIIIFLLLSATILVASENGGITDAMANLVFQLGVIIIVAKLTGMLFSKLKMPSVLGELIAGIIIGPYLLGSIPIPGFHSGLFPILPHSLLPVSTELYSIATIASILLLFIVGMETDLALFLKFSVAGSIVGISGVIASFGLGAGITAYWYGLSFMEPICLFMGVLSTATSVGITARIFSDSKKMDTPEGVTILSAAVIDDVLGIILLAVVIGISGITGNKSGISINWNKIIMIGVKAVSVWLGATILGMILASRISKFLKTFKSVHVFAMLAFAMGLLLSAFFEKEGLAMIIGAYVMGLTLSKTDITFAVQDELRSLYNFFVPVFFTVMGMMVDLKHLFSPEVLIFGLIFTVIAVLAKFIGCGIPSLFMNFNLLGASRIGLGMVPRGEVALIIAGIGLSAGVLEPKMFSISILMTLLTTLIPPPILSWMIKLPKRGIKKDIKGFDTVTTEYILPQGEVRELIISGIITSIENEGFFVNKVEMENEAYHMRKDNVFFTMTSNNTSLIFDSDRADVSFIRNIVYESILSIYQTLEKFKDIAKTSDMHKDLISNDSRADINLLKVLTHDTIKVDLKGNNKNEIINELIDILFEKRIIADRETIYQGIIDRESIMSTGMQNGVAMPHCRVALGDQSILAALGIKKEGVNFESLDGQPSNIFFLLISNKNSGSPHIQYLSAMSSILNIEEARQELINAKTPAKVLDILNNYKKSLPK